MSNKELDILRLIRSKAQEVMPADAKVYLYGSRARGDNRTDSDWDILILLAKPRAEMSDYDAFSYPLTALGWEYGQSIVPVVYGIGEWTHPSSLLFRRNVEQDAVVLL